MLDLASLARVLQGLAAEGHFAGFEGYAYRSIALRHFRPPKQPAPLFAAQPGPIGTRFVPPNRPIASLYLANEVETAHREGNQLFYQSLTSPGLGMGLLNPPQEVVMLGVRVSLGALLDVRSVVVMDRLETDRRELLSPWKTVPDAPTQRLGEAVYEATSFEGLIYESAQNPGGPCLAIFPERIAGQGFVEFRSMTSGVPDARLTASTGII